MKSFLRLLIALCLGRVVMAETPPNFLEIIFTSDNGGLLPITSLAGLGAQAPTPNPDYDAKRDGAAR